MINLGPGLPVPTLIAPSTNPFSAGRYPLNRTFTVGDEAKVAAGSVVLKDVPAHCTVAGVPAKVVGGPSCCQPAKSMDQGIPDQATG